jgi:hypothetical protein
MPEAAITINGERLADHDARLVRIAVETLHSTLAHQLGFAWVGIALTDTYLDDLNRLQAQLGSASPSHSAGDNPQNCRATARLSPIEWDKPVDNR